jgi:hypothetical protein
MSNWPSSKVPAGKKADMVVRIGSLRLARLPDKLRKIIMIEYIFI